MTNLLVSGGLPAVTGETRGGLDSFAAGGPDTIHASYGTRGTRTMDDPTKSPGDGDPAQRDDITERLAAWSDGSDEALLEILPRLYDDLRRIASRLLAGERQGHTLETSALVHEAYLRLGAQERARWRNRGHFLSVAASMMRRILVDHARRRLFDKRGGGAPVVSLDEAVVGASETPAELVALDEALDALAEVDAEQARVVELRYFGGLTVHETAEVLAVSVPTVVRRWRMARSWLFRQLRSELAADG
ncbi:MAG: sigma-70 family RNA polymerase sigma factor [Acidobacteriota bacterium]